MRKASPNRGYIPVIPSGRESVSAQERDLIRRRTVPFIERGGTRYSLEHLMGEAYLQGMRDAVAVMKKEPRP